MKTWVCNVCGWEFEGEEPPEECELCMVGPEEFAEQEG